MDFAWIYHKKDITNDNTKNKNTGAATCHKLAVLCLKCRSMPAKAKQQASAIDGGKRRSSQAKGAPPGKKLRTEFTEEDLVTVLGFT